MHESAPLRPSILVVDDSDDGREMLVEYLAFREFQVIAARNGAEAIDAARRVRPHIILMDLSMAGVDGWEATRRLKADALTNHIVIIAFTAHAFPAERESARAAGCDAVIAKPFDLVVLADALERVVSHGLTALDAKAVTLNAARRDAPPPTRNARRGPPLTAHDTRPSRTRKPAKAP
jgi:CheY-like chemotaxis protein